MLFGRRTRLNSQPGMTYDPGPDMTYDSRPGMTYN